MIVEIFGELSSTGVSIMRRGNSFGSTPEDLQDGNTLPRLCSAAGKGACQLSCQLNTVGEYIPKICAEENVALVAEEFGIGLDSLVLASATDDNVVFGDDIAQIAIIPEEADYQKVPATNAFFFRPFIDKTLAGERMRAVAMRMADCGAVAFEFKDKRNNLVLGQVHFSRTNMRGPSEFKDGHEVDGERVSWAEYVIDNAIKHYGADPSSIKIKLTAAVEGKDFIHHYETVQKMHEHYPGWNELGFLHPEKDKEANFDCLIDYREMIDWQLKRAAERFGIPLANIDIEDAINTGDISLGHASHHWASTGRIEHGRDMYIVGVTEIDARIDWLERSIIAAADSVDGYSMTGEFEQRDDAWSRMQAYESELEDLRRVKATQNISRLTK